MSLRVELDNRNAELAVADAEEARLTRELSELRAWRKKVEADKADILAQMSPRASQARRRAERFKSAPRNQRIRNVAMTPIKLNFKYPLTAAFTTADGTPVEVDGAPTWSVSDLSLAATEPTDDPFTVKLAPIASGEVSVFAVADADLGEGKRPITLQADFSIAPMEAETGTISVGDAEAR